MFYCVNNLCIESERYSGKSNHVEQRAIYDQVHMSQRHGIIPIELNQSENKKKDGKKRQQQTKFFHSICLCVCSQFNAQADQLHTQNPIFRFEIMAIRSAFNVNELFCVAVIPILWLNSFMVTMSRNKHENKSLQLVRRSAFGIQPSYQHGWCRQ